MGGSNEGAYKMLKCRSCGYSEPSDDASFCAACGASLTVLAPQLETAKTMPSPWGNRITFDRKDFEAFLAENQTVLDRSQRLMKRIDELEKEKGQLRDELQEVSAKLESKESSVSSNRRTDDSVKKTRETIARLNKEADKRISKWKEVQK